MESAALAAAAEQLSALCTAAAEFGIPEPPGSWQRVEAAVHAVVIGQAPAVAAADAGDTGAALLSQSLAQPGAPWLHALRGLLGVLP